MSLVDCDIRDGIARITLNRPEKRNALSGDLMHAFIAALHRAEDEARVVLISGAGKVFCAGADLKEVAALSSEAEIRAHAERMSALLSALCDLHIPSIAVVTGAALGAGCGIVCACDMAIAAPGAKLGFPELAKGILPALVVPPLVNAVGPRQALTMLSADGPISASKALELGIVTQLSEDPAAEAEATATRLARVRTDRLATVKSLIRASATGPIETARISAIDANVSGRRPTET